MIVPKKNAPNLEKNSSVQKKSRHDAPSDVRAPESTLMPM
jgi:hypothetical protein